MVVEKKSIGKLINGYCIETEISSSLTCDTFLAKYIAPANGTVVIKVLHTPPLSQQMCDQFFQEARLLKLLKHPSVLPPLDVGIVGDSPYLITEYMPEGCLRDRINDKLPRPLTVQETLGILTQIGQALQYAHQLNIVHGNLKPENILFNEQGDALLTDFGLSTIRDMLPIEDISKRNTCQYMAPEEFQGRIIKESDQYALGSIAYELLTGRAAFTAADFSTMARKLAREEPIAPTQLNMLLPIHIERAILKAMAKQEADRYPHVRDFLAALETEALWQKQPPAPIQAVSFVQPLRAPLLSPGVSDAPQEIKQQQIAEENTGSVPEPLQVISDTPEVHQQAAPTFLPTNKEGYGSNFTEHTINIGSPIDAPAREEGYSSNLAEHIVNVAPPVDSPPHVPGMMQAVAQVPLVAGQRSGASRPVSTVFKNSMRGKNADGQGQKLKPLWLLLIVSWLVITAIILGMLYFVIPSTFSSKPNPRAILQKSSPTLSPVSSPVLPGILPPKPSPILSPTPVIVPTATPKPTPDPSPAPLPGQGLIVTPGHFNAGSACQDGGYEYRCTAMLMLAQDYQGNLKWNAFSSGLYAIFSPSRGTLSPGQSQQVVILVYNQCPRTGNLIFVTKESKITVTYSC